MTVETNRFYNDISFNQLLQQLLFKHNMINLFKIFLNIEYLLILYKK